MKFLCDVHISYKIVRFLEDKGYYAAHVNEMPAKWHTPDQAICKYADADNLIVVTKDEDFRSSFFLQKTPKKLVRILLGNVSNQSLIILLESHLELLKELNVRDGFYLELGIKTTLYEL